MSTTDTPSGKQPGEKQPGSRWRLGIAASIGAAAALLGVAALAFAHGSARHGPMSMAGASMAEHLEDHVMHVLDDIDATDEQKSRVRAIMQAAVTDLRAAHEAHADGRKELREILSAPAVDRARLEALRSRHIQLADQASQRLIEALADAADVLTPEQRSELGRKIEERHRNRHSDGG